MNILMEFWLTDVCEPVPSSNELAAASGTGMSPGASGSGVTGTGGSAPAASAGGPSYDRCLVCVCV